MNAIAPYEKLKMPVALYDSTSPAAINEKMAPETAPLTVRLRNFSTTSPSSSGSVTRRSANADRRIGGPQEPPIRRPLERLLAYFLTGLG